MALTNYIEDDWGDNSLSGRTNTSKDVFFQYGTGGAGDLLKGVYRPLWTTESGSPSATNNQLELSSGDTTLQAIKSVSRFTTGRWSFDGQYNTNTTTGGAFTLGLFATSTTIDSTGNAQSGYSFHKETDGSTVLFLDESGTKSRLIDSAGTDDTLFHTYEITRDSYSNWELLEDSSSQGTVTDSTYVSSNTYITLSNYSDVQVNIDNLVVK